jgi:hypothetical protein
VGVDTPKRSITVPCGNAWERAPSVARLTLPLRQDAPMSRSHTLKAQRGGNPQMVALDRPGDGVAAGHKTPSFCRRVRVPASSADGGPDGARHRHLDGFYASRPSAGARGVSSPSITTSGRATAATRSTSTRAAADGRPDPSRRCLTSGRLMSFQVLSTWHTIRLAARSRLSSTTHEDRPRGARGLTWCSIWACSTTSATRYWAGACSRSDRECRNHADPRHVLSRSNTPALSVHRGDGAQ